MQSEHVRQKNYAFNETGQILFDVKHVTSNENFKKRKNLPFHLKSVRPSRDKAAFCDLKK